MKIDRKFKRQDGKELIFEITTFPVSTPAGFHFCAILRDITVQKESGARLEQQAEQLTELNRTKDKFFSIIAHDLKSPLGNIIGFSHILREYIDRQNLAQARKMADVIENSAVKINVLLENLLEWSRFQTGRIAHRPEPFDIVALIAEACDIFRESAKIKKIGIIFSNSSPLYVNADINMISTVLRNLLSNAVKFTPSGGKVRVVVDMKTRFATVRIVDNGVGMTEEERNSLFGLDSSFSTRGTDNESGSGLGLVLCKEFVEKNGGTINVKSQKDQGSEFSFTLPCLKL